MNKKRGKTAQLLPAMPVADLMNSKTSRRIQLTETQAEFLRRMVLHPPHPTQELINLALGSKTEERN
jgi:hypothetical protein